MAVVHREVTADAGAGRSQMLNHRVGDVAARPPGELQAKAEIHVLHVTEEALVESTHPDPVGTPVERRGSTRGEHRPAAAGLGHVAFRASVRVAPDQAADVAHVTHAVQSPGLAVQHQPRGERPGVGVSLGVGQQRRQPAGLGEGVGIEEGDRRRTAAAARRRGCWQRQTRDCRRPAPRAPGWTTPRWPARWRDRCRRNWRCR